MDWQSVDHCSLAQPPEQEARQVQVEPQLELQLGLLDQVPLEQVPLEQPVLALVLRLQER